MLGAVPLPGLHPWRQSIAPCWSCSYSCRKWSLETSTRRLAQMHMGSNFPATSKQTSLDADYSLCCGIPVVCLETSPGLCCQWRIPMEVTPRMVLFKARIVFCLSVGHVNLKLRTPGHSGSPPGCGVPWRRTFNCENGKEDQRKDLALHTFLSRTTLRCGLFGSWKNRPLCSICLKAT